MSYSGNFQAGIKIEGLLLILIIFLSPAFLFSKGKQPPAKAEEKPQTIEPAPPTEKSLGETTPAESPSGAKIEEQPQKSEEILKEEVPSAETEKVAPEPTAIKEEKSSSKAAEVKEQPGTPQTELPPSSISEETPATIPPGSKLHTVWIWQESKDSLWQLAKEYYGDPWQWKKIYLANRNSILDPNIIFPKQKIVIPPQNQ